MTGAVWTDRLPVPYGVGNNRHFTEYGAGARVRRLLRLELHTRAREGELANAEA